MPERASMRLCCAGVSPGVRRFVVRTSLALGALLTARVVPFLGLVMALIGPEGFLVVRRGKCK